MAVLVYNIFLWFLRAGLRLFAPFHAKARQGLQGRRGLMKKIKSVFPVSEPVIWFHCASLGEFEQGRPVIEKIKSTYPGHRILLTFFSPSGYTVRKDYEGADWVFYLPIDGPRTAREFLEAVQPRMVVFVKYEFWYYYLKKIKYRNIPLLLVSALFRENMSFFRWYGGLQRKMLSRFDQLFVQNENSLRLLDAIGLSPIATISGDTRFDRVASIASQSTEIDGIRAFAGSSPLLVAGSTWPEDEAALAEACVHPSLAPLRWIIAPHEVSPGHVEELKKRFPAALAYSEWLRHTGPDRPVVLIIDNVGLLAALYRYGRIAYVGGGLRRSGVHNVLEAAVYGIPVLYGQEIEKYAEAVELASSGGGITFQRSGELIQWLDALLTDEPFCHQTGQAAGRYVQNRQGATEKIMRYIQEKRLLIN